MRSGQNIEYNQTRESLIPIITYVFINDQPPCITYHQSYFFSGRFNQLTEILQASEQNVADKGGHLGGLARLVQLVLAALMKL